MGWGVGGGAHLLLAPVNLTDDHGEDVLDIMHGHSRMPIEMQYVTQPVLRPQAEIKGIELLRGTIVNKTYGIDKNLYI